ncbi:hypothetical protein DM02DRAFT_560941, partial [Periconia macrospinosa]
MASDYDACSPSRWAFVITSPAGLCPDTSQRTVIRRHVMRDIGRSRRKHVIKSAQKKSHSARTLSLRNTVIPKSLEPVFLQPMDTESRQMVRHMFTEDLPGSLRIYRDRWYPVCVNDAAAVHQMLASYSTHLVHWRQAQRDPLQHFANLHHTKALASVRNQLNNLHQEDMEACLPAIAALACYAHLNEEKATWEVHMSAINYIIGSMRRPLANRNPNLAYLLRWVDTIGSYAFDAPPSLNM